MSRDARLFFAGLHEAGFFEKLSAVLLLSVSADARRKKRRYAQVQRIFAAALGEPDAVIELEIRSARNWRPWFVLGLLTLVGIWEWSQYTAPALSSWAGTILHKCGLR